MKAERKGPTTRALDGPYRRPLDAAVPERAAPLVGPRPVTSDSPTLVPPGVEVRADEIRMLLVPGDMWERMEEMGREVGASGPIALINIALERLRLALEAGEK